eukprot:jgi/Hompol1/6221/HPOL_004890-RA
MYIFMGLPSDKSAKREGEGAFEAHNRRVGEYLNDTYKYWMEPGNKKLLPDPLPAPHQMPYTLCIELNDSLVHLIWDKASGWKIAVRPGAKHFLANLSRHFEVVVYTTTTAHLAEPVVNALDPFQYAMYRLYREHTTLDKGVYVKDLSRLNRDLSKVILIDIEPNSYRLQPENALKINRWHGEADDDELIRMEKFLEELSFMLQLTNSQEDIRPVLNLLRKIDQDDIPKAWQIYKDASRKQFELEFEAERKRLQRQAEERQTLTTSATPSFLSTVGSTLGALVGANRTGSLIKGGPAAAAAGAQSIPSFNIIDEIEKIAREDRVLFDKQQEEHKKLLEDMRRQQEEAVKRHFEENKKKKLTLVDYMMGAGQMDPNQALNVPAQPSSQA